MTEVNRLYCWIWNLAVLWGNFWRYSNFKEFYSACGVWTCILPFTGGFTVCVFFEPEDDPTKQNEILQNYKYLPHANELFDGFPSLCLTRKVPVLFRSASWHNEWACQIKRWQKWGCESKSKLTQLFALSFMTTTLKKPVFQNFYRRCPRRGTLC